MITSMNSELPTTRKASILRYIKVKGNATIKELSSQFNVSEATIRRDLDELDSEKLLERIHGGAQIPNVSSTSSETAYREKALLQVAEKTRIGAYAASLIADGDTILLDSGTTCLQIALNLDKKKRITVITNDLHIANSIVLDSSSTLIVTGGIARPEFGVLTGTMVQRFLQGIRVDKTFLSADAIDIRYGIFNATMHEVDLKKALIASAQQVCLTADHTKFGKVALAQVCTLSELDLIVTDNALSPIQQQLLNELPIRCFYA